MTYKVSQDVVNKERNVMYKIIGADGKEYGPVTTDQIRQWIAEGRANGLTQIRPENETEWRPISSFPEFAPLVGLGTATPTAAHGASLLQPGGNREAAESAVKGPAIALMVTAILSML